MRFNRVLLLAASVNLAVLAMLFTISCSGDKGAKGKDADFGQCAITDGKLICGGTEIGDVGGLDIPPGSDPCTLQGQVLTCGDKTYDFSKSGCNVSEYMNRPGEVVQIDCGGDISGLCAGVPFDFGTSYCDISTAPYIVKQLPECGSTKYSPNKGEACISGAVVNCAETANSWAISATQCGLDPNYVECKGRADSLVGVFYIGKQITVRDSLNETDVSEYQGTQYCRYAGTANAEIAACAADFGAGYIPAAGKGFTDCELRANFVECSRTTGVIGAFDARTHICDKAGTATASIQECSVLKGFAEFTPKSNNGKYDECELAAGYDECFDTDVLIGIYMKQTQICRNAGSTTARVETCGLGMMPDNRGRECVSGKTTCEGTGMAHSDGTPAYWDVDKQKCFASKRASCYENNKTKSNCLHSGDPIKGWTINGSSAATAQKCDGKLSGASNGNGTFNGSFETDYYYDAKNDECYANAKAYCEAVVGLWMNSGKLNASETSVDGGFAKEDCKSILDLSERECLGNGFLWGGLKTAYPAENTPEVNNNFIAGKGGSGYKTGLCSIGEIEAKQTCEEVAGGHAYVGTYNSTADIGATGWLGWSKADQECIKLNSSFATAFSGERYFRNQSACNASGYFWDGGASKCYINRVDAERQCAGTWSGNACNGALKTSDPCVNGSFATCTGAKDYAAGMTEANQHICKIGGFFWDFLNKECFETAAGCQNGADGQDCKITGTTTLGVCRNNAIRPIEVAERGFGLVFGECISEEICENAKGFLSGFATNVTSKTKATTCVASCNKRQEKFTVTDAMFAGGSVTNRYCADSCTDFIGQGVVDVHSSIGISASSTACVAKTVCGDGSTAPYANAKLNVAGTACAATCKDHGQYMAAGTGFGSSSSGVQVGDCIATCPTGYYVGTDNQCTDDCTSLSIAETNPSSGSSTNKCIAPSSSSGGSSSSAAVTFHSTCAGASPITNIYQIVGGTISSTCNDDCAGAFIPVLSSPAINANFQCVALVTNCGSGNGIFTGDNQCIDLDTCEADASVVEKGYFDASGECQACTGVSIGGISGVTSTCLGCTDGGGGDCI